MKQQELIEQFDRWAQTYDEETAVPTNRFPFAGYADVLSTLWVGAQVTAGMSVLDVGVGTGNLARYFLEAGCDVVGADFSPLMLAKASAKLPRLTPVEADLTASQWPAVLNRRFDRIVSNYLFHEFPLTTKIEILSRLAGQHLKLGEGILIGDIAFPTRVELRSARQTHAEQWEEEFYWVVDEARATLEALGWSVTYQQCSFCAGVFNLLPPAELLESKDT